MDVRPDQNSHRVEVVRSIDPVQDWLYEYRNQCYTLPHETGGKRLTMSWLTIVNTLSSSRALETHQHMCGGR